MTTFLTFKSDEDLEKEAIRRARAIMGFRGDRDAATRQVCINPVRGKDYRNWLSHSATWKDGNIVVDEDSLIELARAIIDETYLHDM
ncbi:hypothetical protein KEN51_CDS0028 [Pseudomonas phage vB_Pae10145-KEN51]|uniref:PHIKZ010 n=4 Tax=root TaxID=1 RepID=Q8SDF2_BPDPK|nr:hypothetical protein [Pseudomonas aeruginosa]NP_803576.1 PHIKZ010 [Pseudomonas phage phiKZ]YP_009617315.1 hypothetical protein FDI90_gp027 [Pseudomonas phage PA7]ANM44768.1 hypothetical protein KTN4_010 [Pseudomonas phage KTN4]QGK90007.1 hypothetical protein [Pseudomonas phage vB_PA32_GUMS]QYV99038.1 hypothetical protein [Pseudomonas phage T2P]QYV99175.1 hypothetical protein [Pseudomonas phage U1B]QYV99630.1 hypothetical protein [Pseudomonas phage U5]UXD83350.1 hypothetical protein NP274